MDSYVREQHEHTLRDVIKCVCVCEYVSLIYYSQHRVGALLCSHRKISKGPSLIQFAWIPPV